MPKSFNQTIHILKGVVYPYEYRTPVDLPDGALLVDLYTATGQFTALSWLQPNDFKLNTGSLAAGMIYAHEIPQYFMGASLILTRFDKNRTDNPLTYLTDRACPIKGEFEATMQLIDSITNLPLRQFVQTALSIPDIYSPYWYCEAALTHSASRGSLAYNNRLVAELACQAYEGNAEYLEYVLVYGLLHDIGKVRCFREDEYGELPAMLVPETEGYGILATALAELSARSAKDGDVMESLFSGRWRLSGECLVQYIGSLVQAFANKQANTFLCENTKANLNWQPRIVT